MIRRLADVGRSENLAGPPLYLMGFTQFPELYGFFTNMTIAIYLLADALPEFLEAIIAGRTISGENTAVILAK